VSDANQPPDPILSETLRLRADLATARRQVAARDRQLDAAYGSLTALQILVQQLNADVYLIGHRITTALVELPDAGTAAGSGSEGHP
jgi:uncharacterized protein YhdP